MFKSETIGTMSVTMEKILTGEHIIDGAHVYFEYGGKQVKGNFDYKNQFHDKDSGNLVTNRFVTVKDKNYFIGADSKAIKRSDRHRQH